MEFAYNGLGDRVTQTMDGDTTTYVLDTAAGLTQVLAKDDTTYLYGLGRIAQQGESSTEYFLGDALGSVRQLVDGDGVVMLARSTIPTARCWTASGARREPSISRGRRSGYGGWRFRCSTECGEGVKYGQAKVSG
ncbi:MAG: hypothetical protein AB1894_05035 [Chloroflexota bacterium]